MFRLRKMLFLIALFSLFCPVFALAGYCGDATCDYGNETHETCSEDCYYNILTMNATKDTWIYQGSYCANKDSNYGNDAVLQTRMWTGQAGYDDCCWFPDGGYGCNWVGTTQPLAFTLVYFNYTNMTGDSQQILNATVSLFALDGCRGDCFPLNAEEILNEWNESTVTFNQARLFNYTTASSYGSYANCWSGSDVYVNWNFTNTAISNLNKNKTLNLLFRACSQPRDVTVKYASRENVTYPPNLTLFYHPITCGDTVCESPENVTSCPIDCLCNYTVTSCQDLDQADKIYCLNDSVTQNVGNTCMDIKANNVTFNCLGNKIIGGGSYTETIRIQANDTKIENCEFDGNGTITQNMVIYNDINNTRITNVTAHDAIYQNLYAEYQKNLYITNSKMFSVDKPFVIRNSENVYINNLTAYSYIYSPFFEYNTKNVEIKNSNFYSYSESGITFRDEGSGYSEGIRIHDNIFNKQTVSNGHCIEFWGNFTGIDIRNNYCNGTNTNKGVLGNDQAGIRLDVNVSNFNVSNNYVENTRHFFWCSCRQGKIENNIGRTHYGALTLNSNSNSQYIDIRNNSFDNVRDGIQAYPINGGYVNLTNNTVVADRYSFSTYGGLGNFILRNNNGTSAIRPSYYPNYYNDVSEMHTIDIDTSNIGNGKPVYYLKDLNNTVLDNTSNSTNILVIVRSNNVTVKNLNFNQPYQYFVMANVNNSLVKDSQTSNTLYGFAFDVCDNVTARNIVSQSNFYGLMFLTTNFNVYDSKFNGSSITDLYAIGSANLINTTYNTRIIESGGEIYRKWWLGGQVQVSGLPLIMHIQVKNQLGDIVYEDNTDDFNLIFTQYREFSNGTIYMENATQHNITLTRDGYYPPVYTVDLNTNAFITFDLSPRGQGTEPILEDLGQGIGSLLRNLSEPTVIFIILLALGSMVGFIIASFGKKFGGKV